MRANTVEKIEHQKYRDYLAYIDQSSCGAVYPCSLAQGFQQGELFANAHSALFWHCCGFAFLYGADASSLSEACDILFGSRNPQGNRAVLFVENQAAEQFFRQKNQFLLEERYFFEYTGACPSAVPSLPAGYQLREIDGPLLSKLSGRITPFFSWKNPEDFLKTGKGYCIMEGDRAAAWAFSAAVSDEEIDIGVETDPAYQRLGLASAATARMVQFCFQQGKKPVWACHAQNIASKKLAEKCGFSQRASCWTVKKAKSSIG